jgi:hypothetical protein
LFQTTFVEYKYSLATSGAKTISHSQTFQITAFHSLKILFKSSIGILNSQITLYFSVLLNCSAQFQNEDVGTQFPYQ